jgi:hypothetical protein
MAWVFLIAGGIFQYPEAPDNELSDVSVSLWK